jgi:hypothetical protein
LGRSAESAGERRTVRGPRLDEQIAGVGKHAQAVARPAAVRGADVDHLAHRHTELARASQRGERTARTPLRIDDAQAEHAEQRVSGLRQPAPHRPQFGTGARGRQSTCLRYAAAVKIVNVVGARPNLMKIAPLMSAYRAAPEIEPCSCTRASTTTRT